MLGSLCARNGILYVGRHALAAHVRPYDFGGLPLGPGFSFRGRDGGRAEASGIAVDLDRRVWVADRAAGALRAFTAFGRELDGALSGVDPERDAPGALGDVVAVAADGVEEGARLLASRGGVRRHALQLFELRTRGVLSLRPRGDADGTFHGLAGVALRGRWIWACEAGAGAVQVFRDGEFHYLFASPPSPGTRAHFEPRALAPLADGRTIVAQGGTLASALLLFDAGGRLLRVLAEHGAEDGGVLEPTGVAVLEGAGDDATRVAVIDQDGDRVQVFTLGGRCAGRFSDLGWAEAGAGARPSSATPTGGDAKIFPREGAARPGNPVRRGPGAP